MSNFNDFFNTVPGLKWSIKSASVSTIANVGLLVDTTSAPVTITLPAAPGKGDTVAFLDANGTFDTNNLIVARNGNTIMGLAQDLTVSTENEAFSLIWSGLDWKITLDSALTSNIADFKDRNLTWVSKTSAYTMNVGEGVWADTSGGAFTITLPLTPAVNDRVSIHDLGSTFDTNNLTLNGNGEKIMGSALDFVLDLKNSTTELVYGGTTIGWRFG